MIDAGENPLDWQKIVSKVDALLVPAPTGNATNNAWRGVEMSDMPIIGSALPKHLLKQLEDKNIAFITCHQSEKYEPVVLYKHLNEQVELYVLDGGQKLAHDSLQKAVEKEDPAAIEQAALKYGLIAALVWYPPKKDEPIKRILYTGNASYERVISALEKASSLTIFQYPVVTASMLPLKPLLTRNRVTSTIAADSRARPSVPRIAATVNKPISEKNASRMARPKANLPSNTVKDGFKVPTLPAPSRPNPINRKLFSKGNSSALIRAQPNTAKSLKPVKNVPVEKPCEKQSDQRQPPKNILPVAPSDIVPDKVPEIITLDDTMMNGVPETAQECTPSLDVENMPTETDEKCRDITGEQAPPMSDETLDFFSPQGNESIKVTESPSSLENSTTSEDTNRGSEDNGGDDMRLINISPYHRSVTKMSMSPNSSLISPDVLEDIKTADASIAGATIDVLHDMINKLSHENDGFVSANFNQLPNSRMHMAVTKVKPVLKNSRYFEAVFLPHSVAGVCNVDNLGDAGEFFSSVRSSMYIASGRELPGCLIPSWFAGKKSWKKPDTASVLCLTKSPNCVEMNEEEMLGLIPIIVDVSALDAFGFCSSVVLMMAGNWYLVVLLLFYPDCSLQEIRGRTVENSTLLAPRTLIDVNMFIRVVDVILNSNLCIDVHFHKDSPERRLEMRLTSSLVRCSLLAPFCSFLMNDRGSVYMGCLEANETTSRLYRLFMIGNQIRTERGVGAICENAVCQLEEAIRQNIPDIYQLFRWKLLEWVEEQSKFDKIDKESTVEDKEDGLSGTVRLSILIAVVVAVLAVAGAILGFVGYNTRRGDKIKNKKTKKKMAELQEHEDVGLQEKTESQAKMTQL